MSQHLEALEVANDIRLRGAATRREIKTLDFHDGLRRVADLIEDPPPYLLHMQVGHLLLSVHRLGVNKVNTLLRRYGVTPIATQWRLRQLTETQRKFLARCLRERADAPK